MRGEKEREGCHLFENLEVLSSLDVSGERSLVHCRYIHVLLILICVSDYKLFSVAPVPV